MDKNVYVMFDSVSQNFGDPFALDNDAVLCREFEQFCRNPAIPGYCIRDTNVVKLGTFVADPVNPRIVPDAVPVVVLRGDSFNVDEIRRQVSSSDPAASVMSV